MSRPSWDQIWIDFAHMISQRSIDPKHKVGAVIVTSDNTQVLALGYNGDHKGGPNVRDSMRHGHSGLIHAEINALRNASKNTNNYRLNDCLMYVTLEPCHMCAKAAIDARISSIVFAAKEPKTGSIVSIDNFLDKKIFNHNVTYRFGLMERRSSKLLKKFFKLRR
mgnify:CR=1 FL=1